MMRPDLLCPRCGRPLATVDGALVCTCGARVPVRDGVPRFVEDDGYAGNFGFEWTVFDRTQLDGQNARGSWRRDLYGQGAVDASEESARTFALKTGLTEDELRGKRVLDAGCGTGRFADVAERLGAHVVGVDLTRAIDSAARNLAGRNVTLLQADLRALPFAPASFDVIYSIGVLHHTPDTRASFERLIPLLKPGGVFAVWLYEKAAWRKPWLPPNQVFSDGLRHVTTRLPPEVLLPLCRARAELGDRVRSPLGRKLLQKLVPGNDHPDLAWRTLDIYDWYSPKYQWKHTDAEVRGWFEASGFVDVRSLPVPVAVRGRVSSPRRPSTARRTP